MTRDRGWLWVTAAVLGLGVVGCGGSGGAGAGDAPLGNVAAHPL